MRLIERLTEKYPCICELENDAVDDGPLRNDAGSLVTTLGIVPERVEEVLPFLIEVATGLCLVVFDQQTGRVHRTEMIGETATARPWWKFQA